MDLLAISDVVFSDSVVLSSIGLGLFVAMGLVVREKAQGSEDMKLIQKERAEAFEAHKAIRMAQTPDRG
jgi:hypothetical protein